MKKIKLILQSISLLMMLQVYVLSRQGQCATISLDPAVMYQTVTGWEATSFVGNTWEPVFQNYKDELFDRAINEIGINRIRLEIGSCAENTVDYWSQWVAAGAPSSPDPGYVTWRAHRYSTVNDNNDPHVINWSGFQFAALDEKITKAVIPLKQLVEANGEKLHINMNYVAFNKQIRNVDADFLDYHHTRDPEEYAEFVLAVYLHMQNTYGFVPDTFEIILEPENPGRGVTLDESSYDPNGNTWPLWTGTYVGQAMVAVANRLIQNGFTPRFVVPSVTSMANADNYFDAIIQIPGTLQYIEELSYHRYGGVSDANLQAIADRHMQYGVNTSMLEWWTSANTHDILHKDLEMGMNSAWQEGTIMGILKVNLANPNNPIITVDNKTKFTRQYYKFVRAGAVRIEAVSDDANFAPLGFINANGKYTVVVKAAAGGNVTVKNLPAGTYGTKYTTSAEYDIEHPDITIKQGEYLTTSIPAAGVITVYNKVLAQPPANQPPSVDAGNDASVTMLGQAVLDGTVTDDGLPNPPGAVTVVWSKVNGPGTATFADASAVDTTAGFSEAGRYVLMLAASDSVLFSSDTVSIDVIADQGSVDQESMPEPTKTGIQCYNNVINPSKGQETTIHIELDKQAHVTIVIYDNKGKEIKKVIDEEKQPGFYSIKWSGKDAGGSTVGSGIYIVHLKAGEYSETKKIAVIK